MPDHDILYRNDAGVFSFRVSGIIIQNGMVLLQRSPQDPGFAFPGGHVNFGETSQEALIREFQEEIAADVSLIRLLWVGENFFKWDQQDCHQICLYYLVSLRNEAQIPMAGSFFVQDELDRKICNLEFSWIPLSKLNTIEVYPIPAKEKLVHLAENTEHWTYFEQEM